MWGFDDYNTVPVNRITENTDKLRRADTSMSEIILP